MYFYGIQGFYMPRYRRDYYDIGDENKGWSMSTHRDVIEMSCLRYIFRTRCFNWLISVFILLVFILSLSSCFKKSRTLTWEELLSKDSLSNSNRVILAIEYSKSDPNSSKGERLLGVLTAKATPDLLELYVNELLIKART